MYATEKRLVTVYACIIVMRHMKSATKYWQVVVYLVDPVLMKNWPGVVALKVNNLEKIQKLTTSIACSFF
jgi:hypothetical protein